MNLFTIDNTKDVLYPLSKDEYDNPRILYHGTSSIFSELIENNGWEFNVLPYDLEDFVTIVDIFKKIGWDGISGDVISLESFTLGGDRSYVQTKTASFTPDYHTARNYSRHPGGESVFFLFNAMEDILKICDDNELRQNHISEIQTELNKNLIMQKKVKNPEVLDDEISHQKTFLTNLTSDFLTKSKPVVLELKEKYSQMIKKNIPIVYVIKAEPDYFQEGIFENEPFSLRYLQLELRPIVSIPHSSIIAKIIFPNGIVHFKTFMNTVQPVKWQKQEWNDYCVENRQTEFQINDI
jgi:hypothetical protein